MSIQKRLTTFPIVRQQGGTDTAKAEEAEDREYLNFNSLRYQEFCLPI